MQMNFIPSQDKTAAPSVPFFENARQEDGWKGHETKKTVEQLQEEIRTAILRLGGHVTSFQSGQYKTGDQNRDGYRVFFILTGEDTFSKGRIDIAALPVDNYWNDRLRDKSRRMVLYMLRESLAAAWLQQQFSPGYAALMPWMLVAGDRTLTQIWTEGGSSLGRLLPDRNATFTGDGGPAKEVVDGDFRET